MASRDAGHRTIFVLDIAGSTHPFRTNADRLVMREVMYGSLEEALSQVGFTETERQQWYWEDRGDGVLVLVPPDVPKSRLVAGLPERLQAVLGGHNAAMEELGGDRATARQVRLRVALHAGEVAFDRRGVVGAAIDHTFRLVDAPPLRAALAGSTDACALIVSDWFYNDVVYHHEAARPELYQHVGCAVKGTELSAWLREARLTLKQTA
jgi:hypothetical protein